MRGILVTGTPGVGKSTFAKELAKRLNLEYVEVGQIIKDEELHAGFDSERECTIFDEDAVYEALENRFAEQKEGWVVDFHSTTPMALRRWFQLIVILGCETEVLWNRLEQRGYPESKIQENLECEIMQVVADEVRDYFEEDELEDQPRWLDSADALRGEESKNSITVCKLQNNNSEEMQSNLDAVSAWVK